MTSHRKITMYMLAGILSVIATTASVPALAGGWGAFIGGVAASRIAGNIRDRTEAEQQQAYYSQQQATIAQAQAAAPRQPSDEQRLNQLNKLATGGYITPEEYKAKKKEILDSM